MTDGGVLYEWENVRQQRSSFSITYLGQTQGCGQEDGRHLADIGAAQHMQEGTNQYYQEEVYVPQLYYMQCYKQYFYTHRS